MAAPQELSPDRAAARFFAVVPAAGRSARMGQPKLLLPWGNGTIIQCVLAQWRASRAARTIVVVHPDDAQLAALCQAAGAIVVQPRVPPPDMKASVRYALAWIGEHEAPAEQDAWLLAPADMPLVTTAVIDALIAAHDCGAPEIVAPAAAGRRGHPVLFPWPLAAVVMSLAENEGVSAIVQRHGARELPWPHPREILTDVDTPEEYRDSRGAPRLEA